MYEYKCLACGTTFEELVRSHSAASQVACPQCGQRRVARQMSTFAAHAAPEKRSVPGNPCASCDRPGDACPLGGGA
jgi:putative FmdB family regulatory protein